ALVLLDLDLGSIRGVETLHTLGRWCEARELDTRILVLSGLPDPDLVRAALEQYACGFVPKAASREVLQAAVRRTLQSGVFLPGSEPAMPETMSAEAQAAIKRLTPREYEVAAQLVQGHTYKRIAQRLEA